jgi:hypothetical protein
VKTSIVVRISGSGGTEYKRACLPSESIQGNTIRAVPMFLASHKVRGYSSGRTEWTEPDCVQCYVGFRPSRAKVKEIRHAEEEFVTALEQIDAERQQISERLHQLKQREQDVLEDAYIRGEPITVDEAKAYRDEMAARRTQQPA